MISALLFDFSRVLLFPKDASYKGGLNDLYRTLSKKHFNFFDHFSLNSELLEKIEYLQGSFLCSVFTSESIQDAPEVKPILEKIFKEIYSAEKFALKKTDPSAYLFIANNLNIHPSNILFIDDKEENLKAAEKAGLKTHLFVSNQELINTLEGL